MKNKWLIVSISLMILMILCVCIYVKFINKDDNNNNIFSDKNEKTYYMEVNYSIKMANNIEKYISSNNLLDSMKENEIKTLKSDDILTENNECDGEVSITKKRKDSYSFTIKSICDGSGYSDFIIKGYTNPFDDDKLYFVNHIDKTSYGFLASVADPNITYEEDGYYTDIMYADTLVKYDDEMNELGKYVLNVGDNNILDVYEMEDKNYSVIYGSVEKNNFYVGIYDESFNLLYFVNSGIDNLKYIKMDETNYYYSMFDKVYSLNKKDKTLNVFKEETSSDKYTSYVFKNDLLYGTYQDYDLDESYIEIYDDKFNVKDKIKAGDSNSRVYANKDIIVSLNCNTSDDYSIKFFDLNSKEETLNISVDEIISKLYENNDIVKNYTNVSDVSIYMKESGIILSLKAQYYDENSEYYNTDNLLIKIDNKLNIELESIFIDNYLYDAMKSLNPNFSDSKVNLKNNYIDDSKYIEYITMDLDNDLLLFAIYE